MDVGGCGASVELLCKIRGTQGTKYVSSYKRRMEQYTKSNDRKWRIL